VAPHRRPSGHRYYVKEPTGGTPPKTLWTQVLCEGAYWWHPTGGYPAAGHARQPSQTPSRRGEPGVDFALLPLRVLLAYQPSPDAGGYINWFCSECIGDPADPEFCRDFIDGFVQVRLACGSERREEKRERERALPQVVPEHPRGAETPAASLH
jgi:hypothetical protein